MYFPYSTVTAGLMYSKCRSPAINNLTPLKVSFYSSKASQHNLDRHSQTCQELPIIN